MQARREQDGKHSIGIGKPKRTVRWIDFPKSKARLSVRLQHVATVLTENRCNTSCQPLCVAPGGDDRGDTPEPDHEIAKNMCLDWPSSF